MCGGKRASNEIGQAAEATELACLSDENGRLPLGERPLDI